MFPSILVGASSAKADHGMKSTLLDISALNDTDRIVGPALPSSSTLRGPGQADWPTGL